MIGFSEPANDEQHSQVNVNVRMTVGTDQIKRKRPFLPKVRTGCTTCKIRKVKCDEEKPECSRCHSTGRKCDGYQYLSRNTQSPSNESVTLLSSDDNAFSSRPERRSFEFFRVVAGQGLGAYFNRSFWTQEVLRAATHYPSIRHLVIALGSAYENFENEKTASADLQAVGKHFTLQQANQSIRLMRDHFQSASAQGPLSAKHTSCIVTASILFTYIASLQGHFAQAIEHVRSGLKVVQDFEAVSSSIHNSSATTSTAAYPVALRDLRGVLISVYGQIRCMINDEAKKQWTRDLLMSDLESVTKFSSLSDAHSHVERLFLNMLTFLQTSEVNPPKTPEDHDAFHERKREIFEAFSNYKEAVDFLEDSTQHRNVTVLDGREKEDNDCSGILILRVYLTIIEMRMGMNALRPQDREAGFDTLQPYLEQILKYCETIVNANNRNTSSRPAAPATAASSHSGLGIVMPLHTVAARCRNFETRKRALDLLLTCSRREGMWDGVMTGKIATNTYMLERQAAMDAAEMTSAADGTMTVPDDYRVREVKINFVGERKARAEYVTVGNWKRKERGAEKMIYW